MAISSPLNPGAIAPERKATAEQFQNFISGGSPLGSAVFTSAANKIVGFQRGAARVAPQVPDLGSIINTLSTNILNNVENRVSSVNQEVNKVVVERLNALEGDYKSRVQQIDANAPSKILANFMSLYQRAIGMVQFLGNPRNSKRLSDSITALQAVFKETFDVAKQIRQTINRIVDQLSNLPQSTGGGGGVNVDVDIPGAGLRKAGGGILKRMGGRRGLALGAATLGTGYLANQAMNAMSQPENAIQPQLMGDASGELGGPILDRFNTAIKKFEKILTMILYGQGRATSEGKPSQTSEKPQEPKAPPGASADLGLTGNAPVADVSKDTEFIQEVQKLSKEVGVAPSQLLSMYQAESGINPASKPEGGATGIFQLMFDPKNPNDKRYGLTREQYAALSRADQVKIHRRFLADAGIKPGGLQGFENVMMANIATGSVGKSPDTPLYMKGTEAYEKNKQIDTIYGNADGVITAREYSNFIAKTGGSKQWAKYNDGFVPPASVATQPQGKPTVAPAPTQQMVQQQVARQVAQPPASQRTPQVNVMPMTAGGNQQSTTKPIDTGTVEGYRQHQVSFLPSTNPDNFLTLYSKMVYNIVDG